MAIDRQAAEFQRLINLPPAETRAMLNGLVVAARGAWRVKDLTEWRRLCARHDAIVLASPAAPWRFKVFMGWPS